MLHTKSLFFGVILALTCINLNAQEKKKSFSAFRDSLDNALDISDWLVNKKGTSKHIWHVWRLNPERNLGWRYYACRILEKRPHQVPSCQEITH